MGSDSEIRGFGFGFLGVLGFSMTVPATRVAVPELGSTFVGLGRALVAALLAGLLLCLLREKPPASRHWPGLAVVALGTVVGFPLLTSIALARVPAAHGAVVVGLLPAATAVCAVLRAGERPPPVFWLASGAGVGAVLVFAAAEGAGRLHAADLLLLAAVGCAALGYAEGGRISREIGGSRVVCWALIVAAPFLVLPVALAANPLPSGGVAAWLGFAYVSVVSMFLAFFAWYRGLALGGIARVGQIQLLQPVLSLVWAALLLDEDVGPRTAAASLLVVGCVALTRWSWGARRARPGLPVHADDGTGTVRR